jgi:hypothetical protein
VINFIGNIKRYQLWKKEKWATLLLHLSWIFIISGAFVTRYISYDMMPIREELLKISSIQTKLSLLFFVDGDYKGDMRRKVFEKLLLSTNNSFSISDKFADTSFEVNLKNL